MHFLQSKPWQDFQDQLGRQTFRLSGDGWELLAILERGTGNSRLYCPYGPYARDLAAFEQAIEALVKLGRDKKVTFLRIEPTNPKLSSWLRDHKWQKMNYQSLNPEHTRIIDLNQPEDSIVAQMDQPARNCYRNYRKKGLAVKSSDRPEDINIFLDLIHMVAERTGMRPHSDDYFKKQVAALFSAGAAKLWYAVYDKRPIAAALMYDSATTRYYAHAAANDSHELRKLNAGTALLSEAIIDAKQKQKITFDLYGVVPADSPSSHPWYGFSRFKRSFGGEDIDFAGTWDLPLKPLAYYAYRLYQTVRK